MTKCIKIRAEHHYRLDVSPLAKLRHTYTYHCKESLLNRSVM